MRRQAAAGPAHLLSAVAAAILALPASISAQPQEVRFTPQAASAAQRDLAGFLRRGGYEIWARDTVLARDAIVEGDVLVLDAAARLAATVRGSIYVVDGDLFLRPGARVTGDVVVLGGGFYRSGMAEVEGRVLYRPNELLRVIPEAGGYRIFPVQESVPVLELGPLYGFRIPTYQRVDGWTFRWGGTIRATGLSWQPDLTAEVRFRTDPGALEASVRHAWYPSARFRFGVEAERRTASQDAWIRSDVPNTLSFLLLGNDYRNYYRADRAALFLEVGPAPAWTVRVSGGWEEARSVEADGRTVLFRPDTARANPPVDDGDTFPLELLLQADWRSGASRTLVHLHLEGASRDVAGDFSYLLAEAQLFLRRPLVARHALEVFSLGRGDLAGALPRQRWSAIGGIGTLPTFPILGLRGERMLLAEATYLVPLPLLDLGRLGRTDVFLRGVLGGAWSEGEGLHAEQNLIAGVRALFLEVALAVDPGEAERDVRFYLAGRWPRTVRH